MPLWWISSKENANSQRSVQITDPKVSHLIPRPHHVIIINYCGGSQSRKNRSQQIPKFQTVIKVNLLLEVLIFNGSKFPGTLWFLISFATKQVILAVWWLDWFFWYMANPRKSKEEIANEAIKSALRALRKRHLNEEGAHTPAFDALSRPIVSQVPFLSYNINHVLF